MKDAYKNLTLKFTPLEFETASNLTTAACPPLKFTPMEFETLLLQLQEIMVLFNLSSHKGGVLSYYEPK